jgi:hypothetical protein
MKLSLSRFHCFYGYALRAGFFAICLALLQVANPTKTVQALDDATGIVVDFNPDNGRSDVRTKLAHNWVIQPGKSSEQTIETLQSRITTVNDRIVSGDLAWGWWKAGYDHGSTISSDGVVTQQSGDGLVLTITELSAGKHSLTTWHNHWDAKAKSQAIQISIELSDTGSIATTTITPSYQVKHDDNAASAHFEFEIAAGQQLIVKCLPSHSDQAVILNGFAIDIPDPARSIGVPSPAHGDEHTIERPTLTWQAPNITRQLRSYHVYRGSDSSVLARADRQSAEYCGSTKERSWPTDATDFLRDHFWRVDCEYDDGSLVTGKVLRFRVRHDAFPTAEGYGRFAIGGRGGRVIQVTNLDDSGPGSLREAIEAEGPRTIVFRVGGTIQLKSKLLIRNPYVTIAGQTAPGDGICVRGYTFGCFGTHDVIMRYMRLRVGDESGSTMDGTGFASTDHSIFDHCSISWSIDEAVSSRSAKNITLQRCIVAEALNVANHKKYKEGSGHSFAGSISGDIGSFHHNLLAHCAGRNWSLAGGLTRGGEFAGRLDIRNNVVYNWQHRTNDGGVKALNLVKNLYIPGPATKVFHLLKPDAGSPTDRQQYFVAGNRMEGYFQEQGDNWADAVKVDSALVDAIKLNEPFCDPLMKTHTVVELLQEVVGDVGANHAGLDAVDHRVINDTLQRIATSKGSKTGLPGIIDSQHDVGGWPELRTAEPPTDSDRDGLPDAWEIAHQLNPNVADQNQTLEPGGVTALEVYLAELARPSNK